MTGKGFSDRTSDECVYRVTREERVRRGGTWTEPEYVWVKHVKLCSKRSVTQQVNHLKQQANWAARTGREPVERLISIERAPYAAFEDVTSEFA